MFKQANKILTPERKKSVKEKKKTAGTEKKKKKKRWCNRGEENTCQTLATQETHQTPDSQTHSIHNKITIFWHFQIYFFFFFFAFTSLFK